jgi:energy-coupling factor transporter transmembrane protein EcfT
VRARNLQWRQIIEVWIINIAYAFILLLKIYPTRKWRLLVLVILLVIIVIVIINWTLFENLKRLSCNNAYLIVDVKESQFAQCTKKIDAYQASLIRWPEELIDENTARNCAHGKQERNYHLYYKLLDVNVNFLGSFSFFDLAINFLDSYWNHNSICEKDCADYNQKDFFERKVKARIQTDILSSLEEFGVLDHVYAIENWNQNGSDDV